MRHTRITIVKGGIKMSDQKIVRVCGKHDQEFNAKGLCADCCSEDHRCESCGGWSTDRAIANVEWRGAPFSGAGQMLCDDCVECADCGGSVEDADRHWDYDEYLCDSCVEERDEEWEREEQEQEARSASTLS